MESRKSTRDLLGGDRQVSARTLRAAALAALAVLVGGVLAACGGEPSSAPSSASPSAPPSAAAPPPAPKQGGCYNLSYNQAVAPTAAGTPVSCKARHTTETYSVGTLRNVVDGHLVAVDSETVAHQVATDCPRAVTRYLGGDAEDLRLSMLRPVWFTPTIADSEKGAAWYRCDLIGIAGPKKLISLTGSLKGALDSDSRSEAYRMCGTAKPGASGFARVPCSADHAWRALTTIDLGHGKYPGEKSVNESGADDCRSAATKAADLGDKGGTVQWSWEYPSAQQWAGGQTYGICWTPDS